MSETENRFDQAAATWDENPRRMALTKAIADTIRARVSLDARMNMLDFGCGTGALSVLLAGRVGAVEAVDTSKGMIAEVQRKLDEAPALASKIRPTVLTLPVEEHLRGRWDLICSAMVLHHIDDAVGTVRYLAGQLTSGGCIALADLYSEDGSFHIEEPVPHHGFNPETLAQMLAEAGLVDVAVHDVPAFVKPAADGSMREYRVFLLTGHAG